MQETLEIILGSFICFLSFIILLIPLSLLYSYKLIVKLIAKCVHPSLVPLESIDAILTPSKNARSAGQSMGFTLQLAGTVRIDAVSNLFEKALISESGYSRLRHYPIAFLGYPFFKEDSIFDIKNHISEVQLGNDQVLEDVVSDFMHKAFPTNKPRWALCLIQNMKSGKSSICFKIHHGMADGCSVIQMLEKLTDNKSSYPDISDNTNLWKNVKEIFRGAKHFKKLSWDLKNDVLGHLTNDPRDPYHIRFGHLNLEVIKKIRKRHNVQFISVVIAVLTSALSKHFRKTGVQNSTTSASQIGVGFSLPIPGHPALDPDPTIGKLANHLAVVRIGVPASSERTPVQRLLEIDRTFKEYRKHCIDKFFSFIHTWIIPPLPEKLLSFLTQSKSNVPLVLATLMGGKEEYTILGTKVDDIHLQICHADQALFLPTFTYANRFTIAFHSIHSLFTMEEIDHFVQILLPKELDEMYKDG